MAMLWWEALRNRAEEAGELGRSRGLLQSFARVSGQKHCKATTKSGWRCKGKARPGSDFCLFHDPAISDDVRKANAAKGGKSHYRLANLPDGYLRKLTSTQAINEAMDRLYREVRLGLVELATARALLDILNRLEDRLARKDAKPQAHGKRAAAIRPKLSDLITREELQAWRKAGIESVTGDPEEQEAPGSDRHSWRPDHRRPDALRVQQAASLDSHRRYSS